MVINTVMTTRNPKSATILIHSGLNPLPVVKKGLESMETRVVVFSLVEGAVFGISGPLVPPLEAGDERGVVTIESVPKSLISPVADYKKASKP